MKEASNRGAQGLAVSGFAHWMWAPVTACKKPGFCDPLLGFDISPPEVRVVFEALSSK